MVCFHSLNQTRYQWILSLGTTQIFLFLRKSFKQKKSYTDGWFLGQVIVCQHLWIGKGTLFREEIDQCNWSSSGIVTTQSFRRHFQILKKRYVIIVAFFWNKMTCPCWNNITDHWIRSVDRTIVTNKLLIDLVKQSSG